MVPLCNQTRGQTLRAAIAEKRALLADAAEQIAVSVIPAHQLLADYLARQGAVIERLSSDSRRVAQLIDDYGHHPTEIRATLEAARRVSTYTVENPAAAPLGLWTMHGDRPQRLCTLAPGDRLLVLRAPAAPTALDEPRTGREMASHG